MCHTTSCLDLDLGGLNFSAHACVACALSTDLLSPDLDFQEDTCRALN